jgi:hypothetical protein
MIGHQRWILWFAALIGAAITVSFFRRPTRIVQETPLSTSQRLTEQRLSELRQLCTVFNRQFGLWPTAANLLSAFSNVTPDTVTDGWGRRFSFQTNSSGGMTILSLGADGKPGGTSSNADWVLPLE